MVKKQYLTGKGWSTDDCLKAMYELNQALNDELN